jgi:Ca2+-binding RTX toxin-like protein
MKADRVTAAATKRSGPGTQSRRRGSAALLIPVLCAPLLVGSHVQASATNGVLRCSGETVTIQGTKGPDHLVGTSGADVIWGGPGRDIIRGRGGDDSVCAGSGADVVTTGPGDDSIYTGAGDDYIADPGGGTLTIHAGTGADVIHDDGMRRSDFSHIWGGGGDDYILGGAAPYLVGGPGNDVLRGRAGYAELVLGSGHDVAYAGTAGSQVDDLSGDGDVYVGGPKEDTAVYGAAPSAVRVSLVTGRGQLIGGNRVDLLSNVEGVYGSRFDDILVGDAKGNHLFGDAGNDTLRGRDGADIVTGGEGNDNLDGGLPSGTAPWPVGDTVDGENGTDSCAGGETTLNCEHKRN